MEWHLTTAQSLALIDQTIGEHPYFPAEYEIVRRVIYATADFDYQSLLYFSETALTTGGAAIASRSTIIVDVSMVKAGIIPSLQTSFVNPIYCASETLTHPYKSTMGSTWEMQTIARRYPEGIFVIGQSEIALIALIELIEEEIIKPTLVIGTPAGLIGMDVAKERLHDTDIPLITTQGCKGGAVVAVAIVNGLVALTRLAYSEEIK
ncbi:MAG: precorrin-8X methylmutase [Microcystaceae cyanobacterium]